MDVRCNFGQTIQMKFEGQKHHHNFNPDELPKMVEKKVNKVKKKLKEVVIL